MRAKQSAYKGGEVESEKRTKDRRRKRENVIICGSVKCVGVEIATLEGGLHFCTNHLENMTD